MRAHFKRLGLVLALMALSCTFGCGDRNGTRSLESGMKKLAANDVPGAIRSLQKAVAARPHDPTALCNLGMAYAKNGQHAEAIASLRKASQELPDDPRPLELIVHSLLALNNPDAARISAQMALDLTPESPELTTLLACVEQRAGHSALAQQLLTKALQLDKDYPPALYNLGMIYMKQVGRRELADNLLKRYLQHAGDDPHAATVRNLLNDQDPPAPETPPPSSTVRVDPPPPRPAAPTTERADTPSPPPPPSPLPAQNKRAEAMRLFNAGLAAQKDGRTRVAVQLYTDALSVDPSLARAAYNLGLLHLGANRNEQAQQAFESAIRADSRMEKAYLQAAVAAMNRKQNVEALQHLSALLRINANNIEARYLAGVACVNLGRPDHARSHFTTYLKLAPKGPMAGYIRTWLKQQS